MIILAGDVLKDSKQLEMHTKVFTSEIKWCQRFALKCFKMPGGNVGKLGKIHWHNVYECQNTENKIPVENWVLELQCWN